MTLQMINFITLLLVVFIPLLFVARKLLNWFWKTNKIVDLLEDIKASQKP